MDADNDAISSSQVGDEAVVENYLDWSRLGGSTFWHYFLGLMIVIAVWTFPRSFLDDIYPTPPDSAVGRMLILSAPSFFGLISIGPVRPRRRPRPGAGSTSRVSLDHHEGSSTPPPAPQQRPRRPTPRPTRPP